MAWKDVCVRGKPAGGKVRQDDVNKGDPASAHNAGAPSPGILIFIDEVVRNPPPWQWPQKPSDFPSAGCRIDTWPGRAKVESTTLVVIVSVFAFALYFKIVDQLVQLTVVNGYNRLVK